MPKTKHLPSKTDNDEKRVDLLIRNLFIYDTAKEAALEAGYSESYATSTLYQRIKSKKYQDKIRDYAIQHDIISLPKIANIENKILDMLIKDPEKYPKFRHVLKQKKQIAGILQTDSIQSPAVINIGKIQAYIQNNHSNPGKITDDKLKNITDNCGNE